MRVQQSPLARAHAGALSGCFAQVRSCSHDDAAHTYVYVSYEANYRSLASMTTNNLYSVLTSDIHVHIKLVSADVSVRWGRPRPWSFFFSSLVLFRFCVCSAFSLGCCRPRVHWDRTVCSRNHPRKTRCFSPTWQQMLARQMRVSRTQLAEQSEMCLGLRKFLHKFESCVGVCFPPEPGCLCVSTWITTSTRSWMRV